MLTTVFGLGELFFIFNGLSGVFDSPPDWCDKGCAHMKPSVIVWDLETVPDLPGFAAANDLVGKRDADVREGLGNRFPKHIYHTIVCIGALVAHRESRRGR
jgi:hypothetical protein